MAIYLRQMIADIMMTLVHLKQHLMIHCLCWLSAKACRLKVWNEGVGVVFFF